MGLAHTCEATRQAAGRDYRAGLPGKLPGEATGRDYPASRWAKLPGRGYRARLPGEPRLERGDPLHCRFDGIASGREREPYEPVPAARVEVHARYRCHSLLFQ